MGLFDRFGSRAKPEGRRARAAQAREREGDLAGAVSLYQEAELPDEVARVLILRADAEPSPERRIAFLALAARTAVGEELKRKARGRKALVAFDVLRGGGGAPLRSEVLAVARELEETGELERAADAYALAGDADSEVRALTAAGAIDRLEERLGSGQANARIDRELDVCLRRVEDLDRTAERRAALQLAGEALARRPDERLGDVARAIRGRLCRGAVVELEIDGALRRYALGAEVSFGRGGTVVIASPAVSRRHLRLFRQDGQPFAEDLGTRNGTTLAGARLAGPIPVGAGLQLELGGAIPLAVEPTEGDGGEGGVRVRVTGNSYLLPLGPLAVGPWRLEVEQVGDEEYVVLCTPDGAPPPFLGDYRLSARVELGVGDEIRASRGGPVRLRVPLHRPSPGDEPGGAPR